MSFKIDRGLFKLDFIDHYAVLGIPANADEKEVRKRYLKIARRLHPDSCKAESAADKKLANELLTKLVNPAYEQLSRHNRDYLASLALMGKRLAAEKGRFSVGGQAAKQLAQSGLNVDNAYKSAIQNLASKQYESLDQALERIGEISELNMVYLMLKEGRGLTTQPIEREGIEVDKKEVDKKDDKPTPPPPPPPEDTYIRRAKGFLEKNNFAAAVLELREALKLQPSNSSAHGLLGYAYLKQNQAAMAKVHINKSLQLNPQEEIALKCKQHLEKLTQKSGGGGASAPPKPAQSKPSQSKSTQSQPSDKKSGGGGLFGGLFGGNKKK